MSNPGTNITSVLKESRKFAPSTEFSAAARIPSLAEYERLAQWAKDKPDEFWAEQAKILHWFKPWTKVLDWQPPFAKWFVGATINASYNCLDRHLTERRNKTAIIFEGEPGDSRKI